MKFLIVSLKKHAYKSGYFNTYKLLCFMFLISILLVEIVSQAQNRNQTVDKLDFTYYHTSEVTCFYL